LRRCVVLSTWRGNGFGGLLADDMGLGKTIQTLAHLLAEQQHGSDGLPSLVVVPTTLLPNWRREAEAFAPDLGVLLLHGPRGHERLDALTNHDLVLTSYPLLLRDVERLARQRFYYLVWTRRGTSRTPALSCARPRGNYRPGTACA
jgi:SNF2 family DNA or RNA helicase